MNIGLMITLPSNEFSMSAQQGILNEFKKNKNKNIIVFADSFFCADTNFAIMPVGNLTYFTGDLICITAKDVKKVHDLKRDINIKYLCSVDVVGIEQTFHLDNIEYLSSTNNDSFRACALTGQSNVNTLEKWINQHER